MPRKCLACASLERISIEKALVSGEPLRNISKRVSISPAGLLRHKTHIAQAIVKASERREECLADNLLDEMQRVQRKAWELLAKAESEGDTRGAVVALREVRASLEAIDALRSRADGVKEARILIQFTRDPETPSIQMPERPVLDVPGRVVQPEKPLRAPSEEAIPNTFAGPEKAAPHRENYPRALRDTSRSVKSAPAPHWAR
jgi:hypothetical protein